MRRSWAALTVGVLTLVVLAASFVVFKYVTERIASGEGYTVHARFRDAMGLSNKSAVRAAGLWIGQIEDKQLDETARAKLSIRLTPDIKIYENATVSKRAASLLGEFYLDIDPGTPFAERNGKKTAMRQLEDGDEIVNVLEPVAIGEIMDQVGATLPVLKDILRDVRKLTSTQLQDIAANVNDMVVTNSAVLERLLAKLDRIAGDIEGVTTAESENIKISLRNIRDITEGIKKLVGTSEGQVSATGDELRSSIQKLQASVDHVERITGRLADGEGTAGRLLTDDTIANNVEQITGDASDLVGGIARLQTLVGLRTEYNYLANTFKSYFQIQLMPRPDKFYLIEIIDDPRGFRTAENTIINSSRDGTISESKITVSEKLRFSFMFGKRIGPFAGRFGIKESTGGVGGDLYLFDDRLTLSTDIFDTRSNRYPRVQGRAYLAVYKKYLHLIAGVDDVFNYTRNQGGAGGFFDWFFGAQLSFNDEDLKGLFVVGGGSALSGASK